MNAHSLDWLWFSALSASILEPSLRASSTLTRFISSSGISPAARRSLATSRSWRLRSMARSASSVRFFARMASLNALFTSSRSSRSRSASCQRKISSSRSAMVSRFSRFPVRENSCDMPTDRLFSSLLPVMAPVTASKSRVGFGRRPALTLPASRIPFSSRNDLRSPLLRSEYSITRGSDTVCSSARTGVDVKTDTIPGTRSKTLRANAVVPKGITSFIQF